MIIDCHLKSLIKNYLETVIVGFGQVDGLGLSMTFSRGGPKKYINYKQQSCFLKAIDNCKNKTTINLDARVLLFVQRC